MPRLNVKGVNAHLDKHVNSAASLWGIISSPAMLPIYVLSDTMEMTIMKEEEAGRATVKKKEKKKQ